MDDNTRIPATPEERAKGEAREQRIWKWLTNPTGRAMRVGRTGSDVSVAPPGTDDGFGVADLEDVRDLATDDYVARGEASPETYAARRLGELRRKLANRRETGKAVRADTSAVELAVAPSASIGDKISPELLRG